jgi:hypothetical protein
VGAPSLSGATPRDLAAFAAALESPPAAPDADWQPLIVHVAPGEFDPFAALCRERRIRVVDAIERQLTDLAQARLPSQGPPERRRFVDQLVAAAGGAPHYGNWVYLGWEAKVLHILDRDAYIEVITNRNRDKITTDEQRRLSGKRIGVVGLSVGGEAAVTLAQEHLCGEIVLADFDRLDLSNLNRLNAGCDELGHRKTTIVARRIAKIDPYLGVRVFEEGVTAENVAAFLDGLDLLVDECDSLDLKYRLRVEARARGIDVVFAADERGFLSVEPYGGRPELRPFHGRLGAPQPAREAFPSPLAWFKALTEWLGGWDDISERSRQSVERIGHALCGYPQLASEARFAAGQIGHVARRLLLGERLAPWAGHVDLGEVLPATADAS